MLEDNSELFVPNSDLLIDWSFCGCYLLEGIVVVKSVVLNFKLFSPEFFYTNVLKARFRPSVSYVTCADVRLTTTAARAMTPFCNVIG